MQEGVLSLMQMAKTSAVLAQLAERRIPYVSILTNPTTGGVSASFAMLGDAILAEPGAVIGFAGPRVIKQTIGQDLPEGFQTAEFLMDHGMVDSRRAPQGAEGDRRHAAAPHDGRPATRHAAEAGRPPSTLATPARCEYLFARITGGWQARTRQHASRCCDALGNPHARYPVLHVAGTNGKGSVVATLDALLRARGLRVARYTSPHLVDFRERIAVDGGR